MIGTVEPWLWVIAVAGVGVLVIWACYPLVVRLLGALRRSPEPAAGWTPHVSVVIATRDSPGIVRRRVENCLATDYPQDRLEVVVALDSSHPWPDPAFDHPDVRVVEGDGPGGKAAALNAGVRAAGGEVLVFTDTHQLFAPHTIPALVDGLAQTGVGLSTGRLEIPEGSTVARLYWRYERWLRRWESALHSTVGATGAVYAIRRDSWPVLPVGLILDDVYVPMHVVLQGMRVRFVDEAEAVETRVVLAEQEYSRKVRTLTGVIQLCAWLPAILDPRRNPIWFQFVFHKLLRFATPYLLLASAIAAVAVAAILVGSLDMVLVALLAVTFLAFLTRKTPMVQGLTRILREAGLLQLATVRAAVNGARRSWNVWG